jgi:Acetyltransferase (GNAT) family
MAIKIGFVKELLVDSEPVRTFYADNWKRKIVLSEKFFYEWQFVHTPDSEEKDHCVIAYDDERKKVIGVMGLNKRNFFLNGKSNNGAELTTWVVSEDSIGSGIGPKILEFIQSKFDVLIGMGISDLALPIYMRSGFRYVKSIPRFIKVLNFEPIRAHSSYTYLAIKLIRKWSIKSKVEFYVSEVSKDDYNKTFSLEKNRLNLFSRDDSHRLWRYTNHPIFKYKQFLISNSKKIGSSQAFVALREETGVEDFKILHIMDFFGDESSLLSALSFIEDYASKNSFDLIDFYCTASSIYRFMLSGGWFSINDDTCFQFPHLFHPIEMRNLPTTSLIYWSKNNLSDIADISKLYITKQDADLDRPTLYTINSNPKVSA